MRAASMFLLPTAIVLATAQVAASQPGQAGGGAARCARVSSAEVHAVLAVPAARPRVQKAGPVSVCSYGPVTVRVQTAVSLKAFQYGRKQFEVHGEPTKTLHGIGTAAYSSVIGSGKSVMTTVVALRAGTELLVSAPVSVARVERLVKMVLPTL